MLLAPHRLRRVCFLIGLLAALLVAGALPAPVHGEELVGGVEAVPAVMGQFQTPILASEPGRVQNVSMAAAKVNGLVLQPGEIFSFNEVVGPRDAENGWAKASEIYQGEFVLGYGGGICQVSSTLYNAALLAGLQIVERYHHDRPLEYVSPGRDATVVWGQLDFRFQNTLAVPVTVEAELLPGTPHQVAIRLRASQGASREAISLEIDELKYLPPTLAELPDERLPAGERVVVNEGLAGLEVKLFRVFTTAEGSRRELVSHDRYEPRPGLVRVGVGQGLNGD